MRGGLVPVEDPSDGTIEFVSCDAPMRIEPSRAPARRARWVVMDQGEVLGVYDSSVEALAAHEELAGVLGWQESGFGEWFGRDGVEVREVIPGIT